MPTAMLPASAPRLSRRNPVSVRSAKLSGRARHSAANPATMRMAPSTANTVAAVKKSVLERWGARSGSELARPEQRRHGLGVGDAAVGDHGERLLHRQREDFEEFAAVELALARREAAGAEQLDSLVGVGHRGVDHAQALPVARGVPGLLEQLALGGLQRALALVHLARRQLDELAPVRPAELALQQHAPVVEQRQHQGRPRMADVLADAGRAVGMAHQVALHVQEGARVDFGAGDELLLELLQSALIAA